MTYSGTNSPRPRPGPAVRLSALQAANFAGIGIYMPFMPAWLSYQGLSDRQIGLTLAIGMIVRMLAAQPVASLGDSRWGAVRVLVALQILSAFGYVLLPSLASPVAIMSVMAVVAVLAAGLIPLGDHLTTAHVQTSPKLDFARLRLWGSVSFLVMSIASGLMVSRLGVGVVPFMLCACCLLAAAVAWAAPEQRSTSSVRKATLAAVRTDPERMRLLWLAIIASALINASHATLYGFATLHWRNLGIDSTMIGLLWASSVVAEVAMFWWFGRRATASPSAAMAFLGLAAAGAMLRFAAMPFAATVPVILALQALHALSFGAQLLGIMALIAMLAPAGRGALIQGRLSAVNACLMGAGTLVSGMLFERFGALTFLVMLPVAFAGLIVLMITYRMSRRVLLDNAAPGAIGLGRDAGFFRAQPEPER